MERKSKTQGQKSEKSRVNDKIENEAEDKTNAIQVRSVLESGLCRKVEFGHENLDQSRSDTLCHLSPILSPYPSCLKIVQVPRASHPVPWHFSDIDILRNLRSAPPPSAWGTMPRHRSGQSPPWFHASGFTKDLFPENGRI